MRAALVILVLSVATAAHADPAKCTHADAVKLGKLLGARWKAAATKEGTDADKTDGHAYLEGPNTAWLDVYCMAGAFGKPGFFIDAVDNHFAGTNRLMVRRRLVVTAGGSVLAAAPDDKNLGKVDDQSFSYRVADVDGDGVDEVLVEQTFDHGVAHHESISVLAVRKAKLIHLGVMTTESRGANWPTCHGTGSDEKVGKATRLVVTVPDTKPDCPKAGKHYYGIVGDKLVEINRDGKRMADGKSVDAKP